MFYIQLLFIILFLNTSAASTNMRPTSGPMSNYRCKGFKLIYSLPLHSYF